MRLEALTARQTDAYRFVRDFAAANRYLPTQRQIAEALGISPTTAREHIAELVRKGYLGQHHHETRGMWLAVELTDEELPEPPDPAPPVEFTCRGCGAHETADPQSVAAFHRFAKAFQEKHARCPRPICAPAEVK
ncbi:MAG: winged helix-turn-helix transcriptional regulator [Armatimonadetes bacterium]|nr:winged helix-turn-helix transcriptional regulator [Armatimonadota bacterium]